MKRSIVIVAGLVAFVVGIGAVTYLNRVRSSGAALVSEVDRTRRPVQVEAVEPRRMTEWLKHTGPLEASRDVVLTAEVAGKVLKIHKDLGDDCKKGETLLQLDPESYGIAARQAAAALEQAKAQQDQAKRELDRAETLSERQVLTAADLERARSGDRTTQAVVEQAKAAASMAQRNLRQTAIRCPFDGTLALRMVDVGQLVGPQSPLVRIVDTATLKLTLPVSAAELARLATGQRALLTDPDATELRYQGQVTRLGVAADPVTRTFPVEVVVPGGATGPKPGQIVRAEIELLVHDAVLSVPEAALVEGDGAGPSVFVARGEQAEQRGVVTGARIDGRVIVREGLSSGDEVIVVGHHGLQSGALVTIQRPAAADPSATGAPSPSTVASPTSSHR